MEANLELYRVFHETAKAGSFSRAAEALYITQPAVSHAIKQLEKRLGGALFFRTTKGVTLTREGEVLLQYIGQAFNFVQMAESKIGEMHNLQSGEVRIGASDTLCRHVLLPRLKEFHRDYPNIKLHVTNRTSPETIRLLKDGKIDFGLVNLPASDTQVAVAKGMPVHDIFIAGPPYSALAGEPLTWERLARLPLILLETASSTRRYLDKCALERGIRIVPEIELGSVDLLTQFAKSGLGIACVTREFAAEELEKGDVFELPLADPLPPRNIGVVTLKEVPLSVAAWRMMQRLGFSQAPQA